MTGFGLLQRVGAVVAEVAKERVGTIWRVTRTNEKVQDLKVMVLAVGFRVHQKPPGEEDDAARDKRAVPRTVPAATLSPEYVYLSV